LWLPRSCCRAPRTPRASRSNGDYSVESPEPDVKSFGISTFSGLELELDKAIISSDGRRVTVHGKVRQYAGGSWSGAGFTAANVRLSVGLANRVSFFAPHVKTNSNGEAWFGAPMTWTTKVL
jgi:hypothetical protein